MSKRRRLRDEALEAQLASSPIVPVEVPSPSIEIETLTAGEVAAHRAGSRNRAAGILLHRVLEHWDGRSDANALLDRIATTVDADVVARVRQRLATIGKSKTMSRIAAAETVGRELPLRFIENGAIVERRVDRLLRENGRELVVDYKSGAAEEHRLAKDRLQVKTYCEAISAMTGRPCEGAIWYVDDDEWIIV